MLSEEAAAQMQKLREGAEKTCKTGAVIYGWTTGLGPQKGARLGGGSESQRETQEHILRSHAATIGDPMPDEVVRLAMLLRANAMATGHLGVRPELAERFLAVLNTGVAPKVPDQGSLGIGDLQPMAHLALQVVGDPQHQSPEVAAALKKAALPPEFGLEAGEALAIISGSTIVAASMAASVRRAQKLLTLADGALALFAEATRAETSNFDERTHAARHHPESAEHARVIRSLTRDSEWMTPEGQRALGEAAPRVQDSTAVRNSTQQHGVLSYALDSARAILDRELNAATSNPLIFESTTKPGESEFVMGANWSGSYLASALDTLNIAVAALGNLSHQRLVRITDPKWSYGLPQNLREGPANGDAGYLQVATAASYEVGQLHSRVTPSSALSISVKGGQEDYNSMAANSASSLSANLDSLERIIAAELLLGYKAIGVAAPKMKHGDTEQPLRLGRGSRAVYRAIGDTLRAMPKSDSPDDVDRAIEYQVVVGLVKNGRLDEVISAAASPEAQS